MLEVRNNTIIRLLEDTTDIIENRHTGIATMRDEMKLLELLMINPNMTQVELSNIKCIKKNYFNLTS